MDELILGDTTNGQTAKILPPIILMFPYSILFIKSRFKDREQLVYPIYLMFFIVCFSVTFFKTGVIVILYYSNARAMGNLSMELTVIFLYAMIWNNVFINTHVIPVGLLLLSIQRYVVINFKEKYWKFVSGYFLLFLIVVDVITAVWFVFYMDAVGCGMISFYEIVCLIVIV
ncbi:unnamed protein product [Caenorhabditis bovis]|uniref:Uncharacterized protein n=1 Tax=Caenorhabditis bovis TaxID=2654633 RepID=A0A8S1EMS6_9PELO|nr:unnamed protein product [Caenorhabditis bovis]